MRIKELRQERNMTQADLAKVIGVATNTISQYETGRRMPDYAVLSALADFFGVTIDAILGREEEVEREADQRHFRYDDRLRELCESRGLDEYRLAKASGIPPAKIKQYINGEKIPGLPSLEALCAGLGVKLAEFFAADGEPTIDPGEPITIGRVVFDDGTVSDFESLPPEAQEQVKNFLKFTIDQYKDR